MQVLVNTAPSTVDTTHTLKTRFVPGLRLRWAGRRFEVMDVVRLTDTYCQVVLKSLDRRSALPLSLSVTDVEDAVCIR